MDAKSYNPDYDEVVKYSKLVDDFVSEVGRVPSAKQFSDFGGNTYFIKKHFGSYKGFIESLGYCAPHSGREVIYDLIDENGHVKDAGTVRELHEKYFSEYELSTVKVYIHNSHEINGYMIKKHIKGDCENER